MAFELLHLHVDGIPVLRTTGAIDIGTVDEFRTAFLAMVADPADVLIVDLTAVASVDATGLHVFEAVRRAAERRGHTIALVGMNANVRRLFALDRLGDRFRVFDTLSHAISAQGRSVWGADGVEHVFDLDRAADTPATARTDVARYTDDLAQEVRDDVALMISELATNAFLHGRPPMRLVVRRIDETLRFEVHDAGEQFEAPDLPGGPPDVRGHGLRIVAAIAKSWGVDPEPAGRGKSVWFEVVVSPNHSADSADPAAYA